MKFFTRLAYIYLLFAASGLVLLAAGVDTEHPEVALAAPIRGSAHAPVTILVFSDFESFPCARSAEVLSGILAQTKDVRLILKHAPSATNPNAMLAHEAVLAAEAQGNFWEMHDLLFQNQTRLTRADLVAYAKQLRLNLPV
jgi:protein-disulfide isomerase